MSLVQVNFQVEDELIKKIDDNCIDGGRSEFIREAIREKLSRVHTEQKEFNTLMKKLDKLDPLDVHSNLKNLSLTTQIIFEEIKKQNEVLKLVHRRSGFAGTCSMELWEVGKSSQEKQELVKSLNEEYTKEIKNIDL